MADQERTTYHGVYGITGDAEPIAIFKHADAAQQWRKQHYGDRGLVVPAAVAVQDNADVAALLDSRAAGAAPEAPAVSIGDRVRKAEIRARLEAEARDKRLEEEVRAELAAEQDGGEVVPLTEAGDLTVTAAQRDALVSAGFKTADDIRAATDEQLLAVPGIGPKTVADLREAAKA
jgi:hypothetical protein